MIVLLLGGIFAMLLLFFGLGLIGSLLKITANFIVFLIRGLIVAPIAWMFRRLRRRTA
jgi:hypothetical protein